MAIPTSDISLTSIYEEANGVGSMGTDVSFTTLASSSYFDGPNGNNTISFNAWGQSNISGENRIYGLSAATNNYSFSSFSGKTYFYDNSTFQVTLNVLNNLPPPNIPPDPPDLNDINVNVELWDFGFNYQYIVGGGMATSNGGVYGPSAISATNDPIIFRGYWKVIISGASPMFGGGSCDIVINGTNKVTAGAVAGGPGGSTFDSGTYGTEDVAIFGGYTGLYFDVTVY